MATIACPHCAKAVVVPDTSMPARLNDVCSRFPELCRNVKTLQAQMTEIGRSVANLRGEHPAPTEALLEEWKNCPECRAKAEALGVIEATAKPKGKKKAYAWMTG